MLRQLLSILLALAVGYVGVVYVLSPHRGRPRATPASSQAVVVASPAPSILAQAPPRPSVCDQVTSGYYANGHPIGGYLWEILVARHPECFANATAAPAPTSAGPQH
jgi:hypothetical protein